MDAINPNAALGLIQQESNPSKAELDGQKLARDFDDFLLLLTTQLENQDPTEPLDTNEFTQQLVMFASVEQQVATNANIEKLVNATVSSGIQQGVQYIGKVIEAPGDTGVLSGGQAVFSYELPQNATSVDVSILDGAGRVVFSGNGATGAGKNTVFWDGVNSFNQRALPDGAYRIVVKAKDARGEDIDATTYTTGRVTAAEVDQASGGAVLLIGNTRVPVTDIVSVRDVPTTVRIDDGSNVSQDSAANDNTASDNTTAEEADEQDQPNNATNS